MNLTLSPASPEPYYNFSPPSPAYQRPPPPSPVPFTGFKLSPVPQKEVETHPFVNVLGRIDHIENRALAIERSLPKKSTNRGYSNTCILMTTLVSFLIFL